MAACLCQDFRVAHVNQHLEHPNNGTLRNPALYSTVDTADRTVLATLIEPAVSAADPYEAIKANLDGISLGSTATK